MKTNYADVEIPYKGRTITLKEWSVFLGLPYDTLRMRYKRGMQGDRLFYPVGQAR